MILSQLRLPFRHTGFRRLRYYNSNFPLAQEKVFDRIYKRHNFVLDFYYPIIYGGAL